MGIASYHEVLPDRPGGKGAPSRKRPGKPDLDSMGPGVESIPSVRDANAPRSTLGKPGQRGGWKKRGR
jgi:hypothetical protein